MEHKELLISVLEQLPSEYVVQPLWLYTYSWAIEKLIGRIKFNPENAHTGRDAAIRLIMELVTSSNEERREKLASKLADHDLKIRKDSTFCENYISGKTGAHVDEIVGTVRIWNLLHKGDVHSPSWMSNGKISMEMYRRNVVGGDLSWEESAEKIIQLIKDEDLPSAVVYQYMYAAESPNYEDYKI